MLKRKGTSNVNVRNGLDKPITKFKTKYQQKGNDIKADEETERERERERERETWTWRWVGLQLATKLKACDEGGEDLWRKKLRKKRDKRKSVFF